MVVDNYKKTVEITSMFTKVHMHRITLFYDIDWRDALIFH